MAKKEAATDLWVYDLLKEANINLDPQGSTIKEINEALKTASKSGKGNVGFPEFTGVIKDFLIVIENKADLSKHIKRTEQDVIASDTKSVKDYAVNGALFYGKHLAKNTSYKKVLAFGISGDEKKHRISPLFVDDRGGYKELDEVETFTLFNKHNIDEFYTTIILKEATPQEKTTEEILKDAKQLHEDLRNYGTIQDKDKPLIVSGILLALRETETKGFNIDSLIGDNITTDGDIIYQAIERNLRRADVSPEVKRDKLLSQFLVIKDTKAINEVNEYLGKTPLKHYTEFLFKNIYNNIKYIHSAEDYLGRFYGEFMSYSGGDGQNLGIVLTPKHITELFCDLAELKPTDKVLDSCCGTAGFLIAAMHNMLQQVDKEADKRRIRREQLHGLELQPYMFTIATTNMILRGDGKSNLEQEDFLKQNPAVLQEKGCNVGMMNPPYSMGTKANPSLYEINFTEHLLNSIVPYGKVIVIVPQSSMTGKTKEEQAIKANILKHHTLDGVITLNKNTFYGVGTNPCIAVFTAGVPHDADKEVKFINFEADGFEVQKHRGLVETIQAKDKKQHLLDVWFNRLEAPTKFCVTTTVDADDEWLHSFYYFNDEIPTQADFEKTIGDYLTFEFSMVMQGRKYLFENGEE
ncbi:HsdM family class I SAM-dependent methyltransferase [Myroides sp. C15-4]|uniref:HsdM family class I SAM-dependent methyltransferase n=1 Tax=Myroides sp. C15-4 TaxID=3400532 RepID=UPI003D2F6239